MNYKIIYNRIQIWLLAWTGEGDRRLQWWSGCFSAQICLLLLASCDIKMDSGVCPYNMELVYWYNEENSSATNKIDGYVSTLTQYLFNEEGVLVDISTIRKASGNSFVFREKLPAGNYSLISWGNLETGCSDNTPQIGVTTKGELELYFSNLSASLYDHHDNCERIYYAHRTFRVEELGIGRTRVDVLNAHCVINIEASWVNGSPDMSSSFSLRMGGIPSQYSFKPGHASRGGVCDVHYDFDDNHLTSCQQVIHYIPTVYHADNHVKHEVTGVANNSKVTGQFVSYRIRNESQPLLSIYTTDGSSETQVMKEIDLQQLFETGQRVERTLSLRQEYNIRLQIDGVTGEVKAYLGVSDWGEGEL